MFKKIVIRILFMCAKVFQRLQIAKFVSRWSKGKREFSSGFSSKSSTNHPETMSSTSSMESYKRVRGMEILKDPRLNKGMAFTLDERQRLGLQGLIPSIFLTQETQAERFMEDLNREPNDLARYVLLNELKEENEKLFYRVLFDHVDKLMPIVYTPTVGEACQKFGLVYRRTQGLFITIHDMDHIDEILANWPESDVRAIVATDGERILGLGDLGAYGMGIPIGKLTLYVALAGIQPKWCLPIMLDVGTDNEELWKDPYYIGLKQKRIRGEEYDQFVDKFMTAAVKRFGQKTLIHFEDFGNHNAFRLLEKYKNRYCTFNDDIQGTASVAYAGLLAAVKMIGKPLKDNKILFLGAGEASIGIADLIVMAMKEQGMTVEEARKRIYMIDSKGLLTSNRKDLTSVKKNYAQDMKDMKNLEEIVAELKPNVLIGASTAGGAFTEEIIRSMASFNDRPIIFALSNPTSKSECTAEQAYKFSDGRAIFASGSPFDKVTIDSKTFHPSQCNNSYIFPGVALGAILFGVRHINDKIFLIASETLAGMVTKEHLEEGRLYPPLKQVREISVQIAIAIAQYAYEHGIAAYYPEPKDKDAFIRAQLYDHTYRELQPASYDWLEEYTKPKWMGAAVITIALFALVSIYWKVKV